MKKELQKILAYWRASIADRALGRGRFKQNDRSNFIELSEETLRAGILPKNQVTKIFEGQKSDTKLVSVQIWPKVAARKTSHGTTISNGFPELVAPVVTEATVERGGAIRPSRNFIARDLLTPLPNDEFSLGDMEDFDRFLTTSPFSPDENSPIWAQYLAHNDDMLNAVSPRWLENDENYADAGIGFLRVAGNASQGILPIIELCDTLVSDEPETPLLERLALSSQTQRPLCAKTEADFVNRLGHANDTFPLADQQRQVLSYLSTSKDSDVLAVNGPPGTGKTTMLLSAIADIWVRAALDQAEPPIVVAASANNQAVTNIIDAFGKDFAEGEGPFAGRWLPDLKSYGLFLPARSKESTAASKYQTEPFIQNLERREYFAPAKAAYLTAGKTAFPDLEAADVSAIVSLLHKRITTEVSKLSQADQARHRVETATRKVAELLGSDPAATFRHLKQAADESKVARDHITSCQSDWLRYKADESYLLPLFSFLPFVARKRILKARVALEAAGCKIDFSNSHSIESIDASLNRALISAKETAKIAENAQELAQSVLDDLNKAQQDWARATDNLGAPSVPASEALTVDRFADCHTRFQLFRLACHYWEGRWLLEMEQNLGEIVSPHSKTGRRTVEPRWRRRMMLTPCAVSTFASLPGKMSYRLKSDGDWKNGYLFEFIDLLIVDEAGQVHPEIAAPSFSLAKRSLVIGDTQQIEPITSVSNAIDIGNLLDAGILDDTYTEADLTKISNTGMRSTDGSIMKLAQQVCAFEPHPELERDLYLFEHRRCYDEIIQFCNTLCYKGMLQPKRGCAPEGRVVPPLGYLHVDGMASRYGGSRANTTEAATIANWLAANREDIERQYDKKLKDIVGIVTPFARQVQEIKAACTAVGIGSTPTIGTVHSLQGAERPIIIFSPVYSKHADGGFIDMSPSMLNVTVSRAQDSFLVFGDMDVFSSAAKGTPRAVLADLMFSSKGAMLESVTQPRSDLFTAQRPLKTLLNAAAHDRFLVDALSSSAREFTIVSPWVIASTMRRARLLDAFKAATNRGAKIDVFVDPLLNQSQNNNGKTQLDMAREELTKAGVRIHEKRQLHSKIVIVDTNQLCIGSYNWLSADRKGKYARHETSIAYSGPHLKDEIDVIKESLIARKK